jgi:hypothetical protein
MKKITSMKKSKCIVYILVILFISFVIISNVKFYEGIDLSDSGYNYPSNSDQLNDPSFNPLPVYVSPSYNPSPNLSPSFNTPPPKVEKYKLPDKIKNFFTPNKDKNKN